MRRLFLATTALVSLGSLLAAANPLGGQVVGGSAAIQGAGTSSVTIRQTTQNAVINWNTFNIGKGETTRFIQPNSSSTVLNRVLGDLGPSQIYGTLTANGRVFLINPNGVLIGNGAVINTASFLATTHDIANSDIMAGNSRYNFNVPGRPDASIVNLGTITAATGGFAALVAPGVRNSGTISASFGKVAMAAGNGFSLDLYGDKLITLAVNDSIGAAVRDVATGQTLNSLVQNDGKLKANGGRVELSAAATRRVVDSVINNRGVIEARSIGRRDGKIVLAGATAKSKPAGAPAQTVKVSGRLTVAGTAKGAKGGTIVVSGENIELAGASLDASGYAGGGKILIGGDTGGGNPSALVAALAQAKLETDPLPNASSVTIDNATTIDASAKTTGDGGKVVVWSDGATTFNGRIAARGGAQGGNGGFAEVSGKQVLTFNGKSDLAAPHGKSGTLLLDPLNGFIGSVAGPGVILVSAIEQALASADVKVTTGAIGNEPGDLTVAAAINWANDSSLTLSAHRNVIINANIKNSLVGPGAPDRHLINVIADNTGTGNGTVIFGSGAKISSTGEINIAFNSSSYAVPSENYLPNVDLTGGGVLQQYMKVNTPTDLQNVTTNLSANYVLGRNINMDDVMGFVPIGNGTSFTGEFHGLGHSISNLTIVSASAQVGLFSSLGSGARVNHLTLKNFDMTSNATGPARVGALAGENAGSIDRVSVQGATITATSPGATLGGIFGTNTGNIRYSNATVVDIDIPAIAGPFQAGGLVGLNDSTGHIERSFAGALIFSNATGTVELGLLAGANGGSIEKAHTYGALVDFNFIPVAVTGGVVGHNLASGTVDQTYSIGAAVGASGFVGGVVGSNSNPSSTAITTSYWNSDTGPSDGVGPGSSGSTTGTTPLTTPQLTSGLPAGFNAADWLHFPGAFPILAPKPTFPVVVLGPGSGTQISDLLPDPFATSALTTFGPSPDRSDHAAVLIGLTLGGGTGNQPGGNPPPSGVRPSGPQTFVPPPLPFRTVAGPDGETRSSVPPPGEFRFAADQVLLQVMGNVPPEEVARIARELGLSIIASQNLASLGRTAFQLRITDGRSVRDIIRALERLSIVAVAQPEYRHRLAQSANGAAASRGDPAQYMLGKFSLEQAHRVASGKNVTIAVIDSEVDKRHTELNGTIAEELDTIGVKEPPHSHGTAMAGAIVSRDRLLGVAPGAKILAVRAFSDVNASAEGTSYNILKGIEWAVSQGARVINMSFAGPRDPSLERALKVAHDKGVVLVAAAGNAGPKSPPLYPGADPHVIAVTATDSGDRMFRGANQGPQLSVAAPGVDILAPAPDESYQMSTGTSIATAHVSGVVALMLERDPSLKPQDVRKILETTATDLGPRGKDSQFGWGLVNPQKALEAVAARLKTSEVAPSRR